MKLTVDNLLPRIQRRINAYFIYPLSYPIQYGELGKYLAFSHKIYGFLTADEAIALGQLCYSLPDNAVVVEIGSFLGRSTVVLSGARKLRGSGKIHCIDPFDCSGDAFSIPYYIDIAKRRQTSLREWFDENLQRAGVSEWVEVHQGTAKTVGPEWTQPIDLLFMDGDQSVSGVREAYEYFAPLIKPGGIIALHNSTDTTDGHDGHYRLVQEVIKEPQYTDIHCVFSTTFARKL